MTPDASALAGFGGPPDTSMLQLAVYAAAGLFVVLIAPDVLWRSPRCRCSSPPSG